MLILNQNILLTNVPPDEWAVKICDMGLSKRFEGESMSTMRGTKDFMPPEHLGFDGDPNLLNPLAGDMWCYGETVVRMLANRPTFADQRALAEYRFGRLSFPAQALRDKSISAPAIDFVMNVMAAHPFWRAPPPVLLSHPWLAALRKNPARPGLLSSASSSSLLTTDAREWSDDITQPSGAWTRPLAQSTPIPALPPPPKRSSSTSTDFIGSCISLISKSDIRYVGKLDEVNSENSTIALKNVRSMGTEDRRTGAEYIAPRDKVYEYIVFRGSDVKDLRIESSPESDKQEMDADEVTAPSGAWTRRQPLKSVADQGAPSVPDLFSQAWSYGQQPTNLPAHSNLAMVEQRAGQQYSPRPSTTSPYLSMNRSPPLPKHFSLNYGSMFPGEPAKERSQDHLRRSYQADRLEHERLGARYAWLSEGSQTMEEARRATLAGYNSPQQASSLINDVLPNQSSAMPLKPSGTSPSPTPTTNHSSDSVGQATSYSRPSRKKSAAIHIKDANGDVIDFKKSASARLTDTKTAAERKEEFRRAFQAQLDAEEKAFKEQEAKASRETKNETASDSQRQTKEATSKLKSNDVSSKEETAEERQMREEDEELERMIAEMEAEEKAAEEREKQFALRRKQKQETEEAQKMKDLEEKSRSLLAKTWSDDDAEAAKLFAQLKKNTMSGTDDHDSPVDEREGAKEQAQRSLGGIKSQTDADSLSTAGSVPAWQSNYALIAKSSKKKRKKRPNKSAQNLNQVQGGGQEQATLQPAVVKAEVLVERDVHAAFREFDAAEKLRIQEGQRRMAERDRAVKLNDLRKFAKEFKLPAHIE
jgi:hypothetical protein